MYKRYENITREILDTIKVGDLVRVNDWTSPMLVKAVSKNFFVMTCKKGKDTYYSVCSKLPWDGVRHNAMVGGMFHCGCDDWIFGTPLGIKHENIYQFNDLELNKMYLQDIKEYVENAFKKLFNDIGSAPYLVELEYEDHTDIGSALEHDILPNCDFTVRGFSHH